MPWWGYLIIFLVIILTFVLIEVFTKIYKNKRQVVLEKDEELLGKMLAITDLLVTMCVNNIEVRESLEQIKDNLKYSLASNDQKVYNLDQRISERIYDLKLSLSRAVSKGSFHSVKKAINEIKFMIVERNTLLKDYRSN